MKICLVQTDVFWEQKEANFAELEEKLSGLDKTVNLVVLPEMFSTGFSVNTASLAEHPHTNTYKWLYQQAKRLDATIAGSFIIKEEGAIKNRLMAVSPNGVISEYDKQQLFSYGEETKLFTAGNSQRVFNVADFKCSGLICYDLRFPEVARNIKTAYDCLIYVANWPTKRIEQWKKLLVARAIENQCYVVGVNRVGIDGNGWEYNGQSMVVDFNGDIFVELGSVEKLAIVELDKVALDEYRNRLPFLKDIKN